MPLLHNITAPTDILSPIIYANEVTANLFGGFMLIFIFMISFIGMKSQATEKAFLSASAITFIACVLMVPLGFVSSAYVIIPLLMILIGLFLNA